MKHNYVFKDNTVIRTRQGFDVQYLYKYGGSLYYYMRAIKYVDTFRWLVDNPYNPNDYPSRHIIKLAGELGHTKQIKIQKKSKPIQPSPETPKSSSPETPKLPSKWKKTGCITWTAKKPGDTLEGRLVKIDQVGPYRSYALYIITDKEDEYLVFHKAAVAAFNEMTNPPLGKNVKIVCTGIKQTRAGAEKFKYPIFDVFVESE